ncbi:serine/threonine-protein kinase, partial [Streptomyces sp. DT9]
MTRWGGPFARRRGDRSPAPVERAATNRPEAAPERLLLEDYDGLLLLRTPSDDTLTATDVADLARSMRTDDGTVTVIAGAEGAQSAAFWPRLSELLDSLRDSGTESVQLVMAGAGRDIKDRPATARRIADGWGFEVRAPDGPPLVVPGGSLFVPVTSRANGRAAAGGWWRFAPGAEPEPLGPRSPEPSWQSALRGVPSGTAGGSVVEQIPAGLLVRPAEAAPAQPGDLYHAVPVDARRPAVVIGVPYGEDVSAEEVAEVLTALPEGVRSGVRLAPGGRRDVLSLAQSVSDRLDADVEVMTGLPLVAAGGPLGTYSIRSVLAAPDGTPTWMPFVDAVVCRPPDENGRARLPRVLRWTPPLPGPARPEEGVVGLTDRWQVTVTRAGLWVGLRGGPPLSPTARQVDPGGPVIELGMPGELMDASLWPALSGLLTALTPALRERATLHVHGVSQDGGHALRRLAAQHGLRTLRYAAPAPARAGLKPRVQARPGPATTTAPTATAPAATAAAPSAPVRTPLSTTGRSGGPVPASVPASTPASVPAPAQGIRPGPGPGQGPQTQSAQPELPVQPSQAGPGRPGRAAGSGSVTPAEGAGRVARAERARQLREAMATGTAASAGAGADAGTPGRPVGPGSAARPADPESLGVPGASGTSGEPAATQETGGEAEEFDWSDEGVPTGSLGRARRAQAAGVRASGPAAGPPTPGEEAEDGDESGGGGGGGAAPPPPPPPPPTPPPPPAPPPPHPPPPPTP